MDCEQKLYKRQPVATRYGQLQLTGNAESATMLMKEVYMVVSPASPFEYDLAAAATSLANLFADRFGLM